MINDKLRIKAEQVAQEVSASEVKALNALQVQRILHDLRVHQAELEMQNEELRSAQNVLALSRDRFEQLFNFAPISYATLNEDWFIKDCNIAFCNLLSHERKGLIDHPLGLFVVSEDTPIFHFLTKQKKSESQQELRMIDGDGEVIHVLLNVYKSEHKYSNSYEWLVAISDLTQIYKMKTEIQIKSAAIENTMEGVMISDSNNKICYVNRAFEETTGYKKEQVLDQSPSILQSGKHNQSFYEDMWMEISSTGKWKGEIWNRRANGEIYPEWLSITTIKDDNGERHYYVGVFSDITTQEEIRQRLHNLAYYDGVTELPNRHLFMDRLANTLSNAKRFKQSFALLFLDLDRFKTINDTLGHSIGDQLLVEVSKRLKEELRDNDTVSRMGGDEFMILLPQTNSIQDAEQVAQKIIAAMNNHFKLEGRRYHITVSIGISFYPKDGEETETLIRHADIAMYKAKENGRNTYHCYVDHLDEKIVEHLDLETDLRHALKLNSLELHYQPQMDLQTGEWYGAEALLRWNHPERGYIPPLEFIHVAEETGMIVEIGYWTIEQACKQYMIWKRQGMEMGKISINLSPHQFLQSNLVERFKIIIESTQIPAQNLGIEITESAAMPNFNYSVKTLKALQKLGSTVYIDDFGSGFSSLSQLRHLPIDVLKIDRVFIDEIPDNKDDVAITETIIAMAKSMNLKIVAEGIETEKQLEFLKQQGCHMGQGYHLAKPMSPANLVQFFQNLHC